MSRLASTIVAALALLVAGLCFGAAAMHGYMAPKVAVAEERAEQLAGSVREQNRAIDALREADAKRKAEADLRVAAAAAVAKTAERQAQALLSLRLPAGVDECAAAHALIAKELAQ